MARAIVIDSDDSQGESEDSEARDNVFFDEEALESAESTEERSGSDEEESDCDEEVDPFPFTRLPPELRLRVWTLFCPELLGAPRVLDLNIQDSVSPSRTSPCKVIGPGLCLEDQTRALRCVLATNQQSRAFAKEKFPDELRLESDDGDELTLCVNLKTDIAMLDQAPDFSYQDATATARVNFDGFSESLINLALPLHDYSLYERETDVSSWLCNFRSLQRLFLYTEDDTLGGRRLKDDALRWCAAPSARQYYMETFEKEPGYGENYTCVICWPDSVRSPSFTKAHVPKWHKKFLFPSQENAFEGAGVNLFPMVQFNTEQALERYAKFVAIDHLPFKVYGADEEASDADSYEEETDEDEEYQLNNLPNAYESDGIDDEEPEIFYDSEDVHFDDTDSDDSGRDDAPRNPFSSPELSEAGGNPPVRGRKRHVIADSDDEDEQEPSGRPAKRKRLHVVGDSDEEQSVAEAAEPQVISSDSDEGPTKRRRVDIIDSDGESDVDEEHDDQPQRISLKDRLQVGRRNRRGLSDEEDGEDDDDCEDEEEDEEDDDEDDDEDGLIDTMAVESGQDDDEEEDEEDG
ncbi:hypothetical protein ARSEF4850_007892 [Beauveria asiatica]